MDLSDGDLVYTDSIAKQREIRVFDVIDAKSYTRCETKEKGREMTKK